MTKETMTEEADLPEALLSVAMLSVRQIANLLSCCPPHVLRLTDSGKMPPSFKVGNLRRWNASSIKSWIEAGCPEGKPQK